ncbi:MAG: DUF2752 domain-containing protein [Oscillospiraceae bacterium]
MKNRLFRVIKYALLLSVAFAVLAFVYFAFGFGIPCVFSVVTGLECPGCGAWRMCMAMLRGDLPMAFAYNSALFLSLPLFAVLLGSSLYRYIKTGESRFNKWQSGLCIALLVYFITYGILRNFI